MAAQKRAENTKQGDSESTRDSLTSGCPRPGKRNAAQLAGEGQQTTGYFLGDARIWKNTRLANRVFGHGWASMRVVCPAAHRGHVCYV